MTHTHTHAHTSRSVMQPLLVCAASECCILISIMSQRWRAGGRVKRFSKHTHRGRVRVVKRDKLLRTGRMTGGKKRRQNREEKKAEHASGRRKNVGEAVRCRIFFLPTEEALTLLPNL